MYKLRLVAWLSCRVLLDKRIYIYESLYKFIIQSRLFFRGKKLLHGASIWWGRQGENISMIRFTSAARFFLFFFLPDLTNGLSTTTFLYSRSFHLYWTSSLYMYYKKKRKYVLIIKLFPYSIIYLVYIIHLPFIHPVRVRMLRPWPHLQVMNTSGIT